MMGEPILYCFHHWEKKKHRVSVFTCLSPAADGGGGVSPKITFRVIKRETTHVYKRKKDNYLTYMMYGSQ